MKLIDKSALVAEIRKQMKIELGYGYTTEQRVVADAGKNLALRNLLFFLDTLGVKEVGVWKTVDNINLPQADRNKIYCVFTKQKYILATIINHPQDEDLLQWKCTEFPYHRYDMCEGDKYMQIV